MTTAPAHKSGIARFLDQFFQIAASGSTIRTELIAGLTTFLAASYVIIVNPNIIANAGIPFSAGVTATVLVSFVSSVAMGFYGKSPILVAPAMGMNALFTYTIVLGAHIPLPTALGCTFIAALLFCIMALFNLRSLLVEAIPVALRYGIGCGIGVFLALLGLVNAKFVVSDPATVVALAPFTAPVLTFLAGCLLTMFFVIRRVPGALMAGMAITTILAIPIGRWYGDGSAYPPGVPELVNWTGFVALPDFSFIGQIDILGAFKFAYLPMIFVLLVTNFLEAMSTFMALAEAGNLNGEDGMPKNMRESMHIDALAALLSAPLGTSPTTAYLESAAGIAQGGRTGLVAVVCGVMFIPFLFLSPVLSLVPSIATAPALVMVGVFMVECLGKINWGDMEDAIPAFLALILIPLGYSITLGIALSFIAFVALKAMNGKARQIPMAMWVATAICALLVAQLKG